MIDQEYFTEKLKLFGLPELLFTSVVKLFPFLSQYQLVYITDMVSWESSERQVFLKFIVSIYDLITGTGYSKQSMATLLQGALNNPDLEHGKSVLPFLSELREFVQKSESLVKLDLLNELASFSVELLRFVPRKGLSELLKENLLLVTNKTNVLEDLSYAYYLASPVYDGGEWGRQFVPVIKGNQELLGTKQIRLAGKEVAQTVQHWLEDYAGFVAKPDGQREPLDRVNFLNKSSNVKLLTPEERALLLKLLEVFDWFCDPYVTKEVVEYFEGPIDEQGVEKNVEADPEDIKQIAEVETQSPTSKNLVSESQAISLDAEAKQMPPVQARVQAPSTPEPKKYPATFKPSTSDKNTTNNPSRITTSKPKKPFFPDYHEKELPSPPEEGLLEAPKEASSVPEPPKPSIKPTPARNVDKEIKPSKPPAGVTVPHLAKPIVFSGKPTNLGKASLPPILNLDELKKQAMSKKGQIQGGIDKRLEELNEEIDK